MTAQEVLDTSVAQLETLAAFLHEQLGEGSDGPGRVTTETRACNEILGSLRALILKVRTREGLAVWNPSRGWPVPLDGQHSKLESSSNRAECQPFLRFDAIPSGTRVTVRDEGFVGRAEAAYGNAEHWERVLGWLAAYLAGE